MSTGAKENADHDRVEEDLGDDAQGEGELRDEDPSDERSGPEAAGRATGVAREETFLWAFLDTAGDEFRELLQSPAVVDDIARRCGVRLTWKWEYTDIVALRRFRDELGSAILWGDRPAARVAVNTLARVHRVVGQVEWSASGQGRLTWVTVGPASVDALAAVLVPVVLELHRAGLLDRVGECEARGCTSLFCDRSPRRTRRFCSTRCACRVRAERRRERHLGVPHWSA